MDGSDFIEIEEKERDYSFHADDNIFELDEEQGMEGESGEEGEEQSNTQTEEWKLSTGFSNRAKIIEILKNLQSPEVNIYSHASKEFIVLLNGETGDEFLVELVQLSPNCAELMDAWRIHQGKPGMSHISTLLSTIIDHPAGKSKNIVIRKRVDNFARLIVESKLDDIYSELNAQEVKRQSAALNLLASVVRRGVGLASEVAKNFDFKLPALGKSSGVAKKGGRESKGRVLKQSSRRAFINFAMSFVESANPRLLRWILQQRELFSGVLRGISKDDADTVVYVLSLFRAKVLNAEYLIPPGLRSVLFGSATLEQLSYISGNPEGGVAAAVAHEVLMMVCTDHRNGLMPGPGLRGNEKRLFDLMKKLRATEVAYHKQLILAIACSRLSLCSAYLDEFPYNLEPRPLPSWVSAISLLADIVSSLDINLLIASLSSTFEEEGPERVLKCITPHVCSRLILNKGLLHSNDLVRHGSLRSVLESLKILCGLIHAIGGVTPCDDNNKWASIKCYIQDAVRAYLPDPQVLYKLLSTKSQKDSKNSKNSVSRLKRCSGLVLATEMAMKKKRTVMSRDGDDDIIIGVAVDPTESVNIEEKDSESESQSLGTIYEIWGVDAGTLVEGKAIEEEDIFQSKLLDVLTFYLRALPISFDGTFDFLKLIPSNPSTLSSYEITSLLSLLIEYVLPGGDFERVPESMYKHLQPLIGIFLHSKGKTTREPAYQLVRAAMISTGAFEGNPWEIDCWLVFEQLFEVLSVVIPFLCDAVSTVGNSLYKYMDQMRKLVSDNKPCFSPLVLCILQKCLRLLDSESSSFKLHERSIISLYVGNTLSLILQSQADMSTLPGLISKVLTEKLEDYPSEEKDIKLSLCEWRPLKNLFRLSQSVNNQVYCSMFSLPDISSDKAPLGNSFSLVLSKVGELINCGRASALPGIANSFSYSVICAKPEDLVEHFTEILSFAKDCCSSHFSLLASVLFLERDNLARIVNRWPELLSVSLRATKGEILNCGNDTGAFAKYLQEASFFTVFGTIVGSGICVDLVQSVELLELLREKLSDRSAHEIASYLKFVLFWGYQILSAYISEPSDEMEGLSNLCFALVEFIFDQLMLSYHSVETCSFTRLMTSDLLDFLFEHPLITKFLSSSLSTGDVLLNGGLDQFRALSVENLPPVNRCLFRFLIKAYNSFEELGSKLDLKAPKLLLKKIQLLFREVFMYCNENSMYGHLVPAYCLLRDLASFVSPSELLDLTNWMFSVVENQFSVSGFGSEAAIFTFVCLQLADRAMEMLFHCGSVHNPTWSMKGEGFDGTVLQKVYYHILNSVLNMNLEFGDFFLYKAVESLYRCRYRESITSSHLCLVVLSANILTSSPLKLINYCILPSSKVKTRILELILESSPTHLKLFGKLFMGLMLRDLSTLNLIMGNSDLSEGDFVNLLPAALLYVNKSDSAQAQEILAFYAGILLNGFSNWKDFVTRHRLDEMCEQLHEPEIVSLDNFRGYFERTPLGKTVSMLSCFLCLNAASVTKKQRLEILDSIFPKSCDVLVPDLNKINLHSSIEETTRITCEIHAKISLARLLLSDKAAPDMDSKKVNSVKHRIISVLVNSLDRIVRNFQQKIQTLEHFILHNIVEMCSEAQSHPVDLKSLPFLNTFIRSSLLHRFDDPVTLKSLRGICTFLSEGNFSVIEILELLLGHSQFITALTCDSFVSYPSTLLQPVPSIFKPLSTSSDRWCSNSTRRNFISEKRKVELVRLLRVLYHLKIKNNCEGLQHESKELLFLLLSVYGATLRDIDLEILSLMQEVELSVGSNWGGIAEMDYLWGIAVTKVREELKVELHETENGGIEERRKFLFRENIPVDSKMCVATASNFCYERSLHAGAFSIEKLLHNSTEDSEEIPSPMIKPVQGYDPMFILKFSIHSLLMGYIEPIEFCRLGLLAITLVSISSPDDELRKLGYESLATFKSSLENFGRSKEKLQIQLLLMYLQNGISEPWEKIPSVIAIFAAEASLTLLDASQHLFFTISKYLMRTPSVNLNSVPLFHALFQSSSIHFSSERLWILKLLYTGLNKHDDAEIYKKNSILEHLLNFYSSSASDPESRVLILEIVKKLGKLPALSYHLLKECGLLSFLSSVLSFCGEGISSDNMRSATTDLVLEVINDVLSSRTISEWIQDTALEQLSQISSYLFKLLTRNMHSLTENILLVNSMLHVIVSTLRLSQKRKIYQSHFTLSLDGLVSLCRSIDTVSSSMESDQTVLLGLDVILMSTPLPVFSHEDKLKLTEIIKWAVLASLRLNLSKEKKGEECLVSKILRWLTASIIIGKISKLTLKSRESFRENRMQIRTLDSLIRYTIEDGDSVAIEDCEVNETLGAMILYLQQVIKSTSCNASSVLLSLSFLPVNSSSKPARDHLGKSRDEIAALCSKILCPAETNPSWRWSYYQAWRGPTVKQTEMEKLEDEQACRSLFILFSNVFGPDRLGLPVLSFDNLDQLGIFEWERCSHVVSHQRT